MYELIELYIENLTVANYAGSTIVSYEIHLRNFYSYCVQRDIAFRNITTKEMLDYRSIISKQYSISSVNAKLSVVNSFYEFLIDIDECLTSPIRKTMYIRSGNARPNPLDAETKELFLKWIESKEKHIELGFKILFDTGLRISELVNLEKKDVKIIDSKLFLNVENSKRDKSRIVPVFTESVAEMLLLYIEENYEGKLFPYTTRAYQMHAEKFAEKFNNDFTVHRARHTFATEQLNAGMGLDVLKEVLGHSDISTTMYYALTSDKRILDLGVSV